MIKVQRVTKEDKTALEVAMATKGFKTRIKVFPNSIRLVTSGDPEKVAEILNALGFNLFGKKYETSMFHDIDPAHIEVHIHHKM